MIKIFSYGTLWKEDIQLSVFGRTFDVDQDMDYINGWDIIKVKMDGVYYNVAVEGDMSCVVMGAIVNVPDEFIKLVDKYEGREYKRIDIKTMTGTDCQIYVKR